MSKSWVDVISKKRIKNKSTQETTSKQSKSNTNEIMPRLYIWHPVIGSHHVCHISTIAFTKEQAIAFIMDNLRKYKEIDDRVTEQAKAGGKLNASWKDIARELYKLDDVTPIINWEGPFTGNLYDLLDQQQTIYIDPYNRTIENYRLISFEMFLNRVEPEVRPIKLGMLIGATASDA